MGAHVRPAPHVLGVGRPSILGSGLWGGPTSQGGQPLGGPTLKDKIVQSAVAEMLSAIYEVDFLVSRMAFDLGEIGVGPLGQGQRWTAARGARWCRLFGASSGVAAWELGRPYLYPPEKVARRHLEGMEEALKARSGDPQDLF